jgi:hypothetical protein
VRPYLKLPQKKKTHHKIRAGGVAPGEGPEFKPQYRKKNKKIKFPKHSPWEAHTLARGI